MSKTIEVLEQAIAADPDAISRLVLSRVECNEELYKVMAPFVFAETDGSTVDEQGNPLPVFTVRIIGLINHILRANGLNLVAGRYGENRSIVKRFEDVLRFDEQTGDALELNKWEPHQRRVLAEQQELQERLNKLEAFVETPIFAEIAVEEQYRLKRQFEAMTAYHNILCERIDAFSVPIE
jgi:hypothetical protein